MVMGAPSLQEGLSPNRVGCSWISKRPKQILRLFLRLRVLGEGHPPATSSAACFMHDFRGLKHDLSIVVVGEGGGVGAILFVQDALVLKNVSDVQRTPFHFLFR